MNKTTYSHIWNWNFPQGKKESIYSKTMSFNQLVTYYNTPTSMYLLYKRVFDGESLKKVGLGFLLGFNRKKERKHEFYL